jgi:hypothetical protein
VLGDQAKQDEIVKKMAGLMVFRMANETANPLWSNADFCTVILKLWSTDQQRRSRTFFPNNPHAVYETIQQVHKGEGKKHKKFTQNTYLLDDPE